MRYSSCIFHPATYSHIFLSLIFSARRFSTVTEQQLTAMAKACLIIVRRHDSDFYRTDMFLIYSKEIFEARYTGIYCYYLKNPYHVCRPQLFTTVLQELCDN